MLICNGFCLSQRLELSTCVFFFIQIGNVTGKLFYFQNSVPSSLFQKLFVLKQAFSIGKTYWHWFIIRVGGAFVRNASVPLYPHSSESPNN